MALDYWVADDTSEKLSISNEKQNVAQLGDIINRKRRFFANREIHYIKEIVVSSRVIKIQVRDYAEVNGD